jgi:hypothetical protein
LEKNKSRFSPRVGSDNLVATASHSCKVLGPFGPNKAPAVEIDTLAADATPPTLFFGVVDVPLEVGFAGGAGDGPAMMTGRERGCLLVDPGKGLEVGRSVLFNRGQKGGSFK